ncbi:MAG: DUF4129 domain-containing protein [Candidatus Promineifilaceae bacterium]|nr:DUF4129 domain-containing protein [Candidatus Promineifilaceae bacterium]
MGETALTTDVMAGTPSRWWLVWGSLKQELLFLCLALMEISLLTPLVLFIMRWTRLWPAPIMTVWLLLLLLLPFNMVRFFTSLQISRKRQWQLLLLALIATLLLTWRVLLFPNYSIFNYDWLLELYGNVGVSGSALWTRILILFLLVTFVWWRGLRLVNFRPDVQQIGLRLRIGILILIPLSLLPDLRISAWGTMPYVLLFFLSSLTAISLVRAEQIESERSGFAASLNPGWVGTIFVTSLLISLTAGLFAALVSGDLITVIGEYFSPVWTAALAGITVALSTVFYLATPLFFLLDLLLVFLTQMFTSLFSNFGDRLGLNIAGGIQGLQSFLPDPEEAAEVTGPTFSDTAVRVVSLLVMFGIILLVSLALTRRFRSTSVAPRASEPVGNVGSEGIPAVTIGERLLKRLGILNRWRTAASIRYAYQQMCQAAAGLGYPRAETETPYEYLVTLAEVWPNNRLQCRLITDAFVRIRYGELPETEADLQKIMEAWKELEQTKPER